jgi:hypothetical protein
MPTTAETINYNSFLTVTTKEYSKIVTGQYLTRRPAVGLLFDEYRHTDSNGGRTWQGMVDYGQSATAQFYSGSDTFSTQPQEVAQPIRYDWKYLGGGISATQTEMLENSGPVALASLWGLRMKQLSRTFDLIIGNEIFSDGTNFGGKSFVGLALGISTTPTTGAVGGLDPATWPWWQNNAATSFGSFAAKARTGRPTRGSRRGTTAPMATRSPTSPSPPRTCGSTTSAPAMPPCGSSVPVGRVAPPT